MDLDIVELDVAKFPARVDEVLRQAEERIAEKTKAGFKYDHGCDPGTKEFAKLIDHTILKPETTEDAVRKVCDEAMQWGFKSVCVRSHFVDFASEYLSGTGVAVCSVICFPEGTQTTREKITEAREALDAGADELDFVINHPKLKAHAYAAVYQDLCAIAVVMQTYRPPRPINKLILETSQLERRDIVAGCLLASAAGFDFVKTSTGFLGHGARVEDVMLMKQVCEMERAGMKVKASGGIRTAKDAKAMLDAGALRLGLSGSVAIMEEAVSGGDNAAAGGVGDGY